MDTELRRSSLVPILALLVAAACGACGDGSSSGAGGELLYAAEGNRLRRIDIDTIDHPPLAEDILIERASLDPDGRDINGQVCRLPDGTGRFIAGEDTGQPHPPAGWGVFDPDGTQVGKLTATYMAALPGATSNPEPFGCAVDPEGRVFTSDVGNQASGQGNGQLIMWFPPYDRFPGPPGAYPQTDEASTNFCKLATDIATAGSVAIDDEGRVYVAAARDPVTSLPGGAVLRFSPPFPTSPDAAGGCGARDALGSPMADVVNVETFISDVENVFTPTGIARAANGQWYVASVFTGVIAEYDSEGTFVRRVLDPPASQTLPLATGHPQGLAVDSSGNLYYADMQLVVSDDGIGPGPNGKVRRIVFDSDGNPQPPEIVKEGLAFPDGLGVLPGDLER